jgi:hypothetical protein
MWQEFLGNYLRINYWEEELDKVEKESIKNLLSCVSL